MTDSAGSVEPANSHALPWWPQALRAVTVLALAYLAVRWALLLPDQGGIHSVDSRTYWSAPLDNPYPGPQVGLPGAYLYSPVFLQVLTPLRMLPWEAFHALWMAVGIGSLIFMVGPIWAAVAFSALPFVFRDVFVGNIHLMLGAAIVVGLTYPAAWAFPALTKVTPGVGLLWYAGRRQWGELLIGLGVTGALSGISFALAPGLWMAWIERLSSDTGTAGDTYVAITVGRTLVAAAIVVYAGARAKAWLVPIAVVLALPILWPDSLAILLACFPLLRHRTRERAVTPARSDATP